MKKRKKIGWWCSGVRIRVVCVSPLLLMKILIDVISALLNKFDWTDLERPFQKQLPRCKSDVENGTYLRYWRKRLPW